MPDGKICYIEIPAVDIEASARFYATVFGWHIRARGDGAKAFDDTAGAVSGTWVLGRAPQSEPGLLTYIMVDNIDTAITKIVAARCPVVTPKTVIGTGGDAYATFLDPAGNLLGIYQGP